MKLPHSFWADNKKTPDIVYRYQDGTECVLRRENGHVISILRDSEGHVETTVLTDSECSEARFDEFKAISDEDYLAEAKDSNRYLHRTVSMDALTYEPAVGIDAKRKQDAEGAREQRLKAVKEIIARLGITEVQRRRYLKYKSGMSTRDIALEEQVVQSSVVESIRQVEKKAEKYLLYRTELFEKSKKEENF